MRICPKCRNFYADETLKFCPADGVPLAGVDPGSNLWPEGTEAVRQTAGRIQREVRRLKLKRILSMTVMTILTILVVSTITLNSYIYLNPEEKEIAQAIPPEPTPTVDTVSETPTPAIEETPSPTPSGCSVMDKLNIVSIIRGKYTSAWKNDIRESEESGIKKIYADEVHFPALSVIATLKLSMFSPLIVPSNDCKRAAVRIDYAWHLDINHGGASAPKKYGKSRSYQCTNNDGNLVCP